MTKPEPCPFCGAPAEILVISSDEAMVYCRNKKCGVSTQWMENEAAALEVWNRRINGNRKRRNKLIR